MTSFLTDSIIIANPAISDLPKFSHIAGRLIYIVEHSSAGAVGVGLNQNYSAPFADIASKVPELVSLNSEKLLVEKVFSGGPVAGDTPWTLGRNIKKYDKQIANSCLALNFSEHAFAENELSLLAICGLGSYGWGAGKLESELAHSLWHYFPASEECLNSIPFIEAYKSAIQMLTDMKFR